jgi:hypothetical protein
VANSVYSLFPRIKIGFLLCLGTGDGVVDQRGLPQSQALVTIGGMDVEYESPLTHSDLCTIVILGLEHCVQAAESVGISLVIAGNSLVSTWYGPYGLQPPLNTDIRSVLVESKALPNPTYQPDILS